MTYKTRQSRRSPFVSGTCRAACLVGAMAATGVTAATAGKDGGWQDIGASERIDYAGRLHFQSERVAASACNIAAGIQTEISRGIMAAAMDDIDRITDTLEFGNPLMSVIGEETRPRTLRYIHEFRDTWSGIHEAAAKLYDDGSATGAFQHIYQNHAALSETAIILTSELSGQYSNPAELLQADAILVDISGRQRMYSQRLLNEACRIWSGDSSDEAREALVASINFFEVSLGALKNGMPEAGVSPAPTPEIAARLDAIAEHWQPVRAELDKLMASGDLSDDEKEKVYLGLNEILIDSSLAVTMYTRQAKKMF